VDESGTESYILLKPFKGKEGTDVVACGGVDGDKPMYENVVRSLAKNKQFKKIRNCTTKRMEIPNELTRRWTRKVRIVSGNHKLKQSGKIGHIGQIPALASFTTYRKPTNCFIPRIFFLTSWKCAV
jgi:hypothetical protein